MSVASNSLCSPGEFESGPVIEQQNRELQHLLGHFDPVQLNELSGFELMNRTDTKYLLSSDDLLETLPELRGNYRSLEVEEVRLSPYSTLYFDTPDLVCYKAHHNGKLNRRKYRMRRYDANGVCFLEVKLKNSKGRTDKQRMSLSDIQPSIDESHAGFLDSIAPDLQNQSFDGLIPQLWSRFLRMTLVHNNIAERVTIDTCLSFHKGDRAVQLPGVIIAEVKQPGDDRQSPVRKQFRARGIRPLRISKYCVGSAMLNPTLKHNRFKAKLRSLQKIANV
ncbi:polyphosphate polymerase domain-containing protein [Adhaeretor mobilis]|uniref:VTC domain protein n=1 Tax=Adhaeretor mobilis TaxID=1930276 RepID=A0A517MV46_9BACT|nr:polyphosphate polymerase domain-containing protein [Adhaeretor mobilis]QDS98657.1 VTC domain protein [Adhaeretor mobilis]